VAGSIGAAARRRELLLILRRRWEYRHTPPQVPSPPCVPEPLQVPPSGSHVQRLQEMPHAPTAQSEQPFAGLAQLGWHTHVPSPPCEPLPLQSPPGALHVAQTVQLGPQ
jgi:hypothetical protein